MLSGNNIFSSYQPGSAGNILYGIFGDAGSPFDEASQQMDQMFPQGQKYQMPFYKAGTDAIPNFQNWLQKMQDPSSFIKNIMGQYQESPFAKFQQDQSMRAATNMGSATGLTGSTPLMQFAQQNARDISSQDQNSWLQNVLGVNNQYGAGQQNLMGMGQNSANSLMKYFQDYMQNKTAATFGKEYANQQQMGGLFSGLAGLFGL